MSIYLSKKFWGGTLERAVKTFAQSAVALITAEYTSLIEIDILSLVSVAGLAAIVSVLTRVASAGDDSLKAEVISEYEEKEQASEYVGKHTKAYIDKELGE